MKERKLKLRFDLKYFIGFLMFLGIEVLIALYINDNFIRPLVGDMLVMALMYTAIKSFIQIETKFLPLYLLIFAFAVELSQGMGLVNIIGLGDNKVANIVMGSTFDKNDLLSYAIASGVLVIWDRKKFEFLLTLVITNGLIYLYCIDYILKQMAVMTVVRVVLATILLIAFSLIFLLLNSVASFKKSSDSPRLNILMGGRKLIRTSYALLCVNSIWLLLFGNITQGFLKNEPDLNMAINISSSPRIRSIRICTQKIT